ncbi:precorrin-3B C(17)-methyltransferase [Lichenihabitans sp. Uapishka_5]|uniref:precorrin-3B C(17)-methyltransferase n=1 Tax=Lichenihabitans sp. Uapishka_5 TaxID=3037302 RepID=UPI0029E7CDC8|nr:precorrin-3B C(17)-methyltransferase [Lichenihabitans sp. Uapishka_5]MDX7953553.1 precorrin-3B C(17)-methyltransferase [Lichenihabitans sp. Uapishka_5]
MSGSLSVVGLGPGPAYWLTPEADAVLKGATDLVGYAPYVDRLPQRPGQARHASDNRVELDRAHAALDLAQAGRHVAVVSGGDPGVFAMAAAVFEAVEARPVHERDLPIQVVPGISAMLAAAARLGAPLGHDFCALSLSDNLKPWTAIERRLRAAADGDFVMAFYNPVSKARPDRLREALALLGTLKASDTVVAFARAIGRPTESLSVTTLAAAVDQPADMSTLVIVGSSETRIVARPAGTPWVLTPRSYRAGA